ncbi:hypothetical protein ElyMa_004785300 [Elysia marginata]|uniref:Protein quiver n=1 Tax=Elysia marginata TaxID=1093978 RepID=A0AAV4IEA9_9GAST|nr:hypothetical protein ElyMa_004785300 [Elysia marginata]
MDYHLNNFDKPIEEKDGIKKCYQCINYDKAGNYYRQCPKHGRVRNAYLGACNGTCFTRSYNYNDSCKSEILGSVEYRYHYNNHYHPHFLHVPVVFCCCGDPRWPVVARGCTDSQYGLPDPLPPDGCYKYYSEVWCVCSTSRCNGKPLGKAQDIEFDAHIDDSNKGNQLGLTSAVHFVVILLLNSLAISLEVY